MKTVYQLDADGVYVGDAIADASPLEDGVFLIPANCVEAPPPVIPVGNVARFVNGSWQIEPEPTPPADPLPQVADQVLAERDRLYDESYKAILDAFEAGTPVSQGLKDYRQALRDIETQPGFPDAVIWPVAPT